MRNVESTLNYFEVSRRICRIYERYCGLLTEKDISRIKDNRLQIMGFASLWIVFFHFLVEFTGIFEKLRLLGYGGVDMFMLLSGMSMYQSYVRNGNRNAKVFYIKRIRRVVPEYIVFLVVGLFIDASFRHKLLWVYIREDSLFATIHKIIIYRWFVPCILLAYVITPVVDRVLFGKRKKTQCRFVWLVLLMVIVTFAFWNRSTALMVLIRIPTYVVGYYFGSDISFRWANNKKWNIPAHILLVTAGGALIVKLCEKHGDIAMAEYGIWWYPWLVMALPMCVLVSLLFGIFKRVRLLKWISTLFAFLGSISLEIYLWQWLIMGYMVACLGKFANRALVCFISVPMTVFVSWIYSMLFNRRMVKNVNI